MVYHNVIHIHVHHVCIYAVPSKNSLLLWECVNKYHLSAYALSPQCSSLYNMGKYTMLIADSFKLWHVHVHTHAIVQSAQLLNYCHCSISSISWLGSSIGVDVLPVVGEVSRHWCSTFCFTWTFPSKGSQWHDMILFMPLWGQRSNLWWMITRILLEFFWWWSLGCMHV